MKRRSFFAKIVAACSALFATRCSGQVEPEPDDDLTIRILPESLCVCLSIRGEKWTKAYPLDMVRDDWPTIERSFRHNLKKLGAIGDEPCSQRVGEIFRPMEGAIIQSVTVRGRRVGGHDGFQQFEFETDLGQFVIGVPCTEFYFDPPTAALNRQHAK